MQTAPRQEIHQRIRKFQTRLAARQLDGAFILQNADLYYFSGTIQSAVLFVPAHGQPHLMVLKNIKRAELESSLENIIPVENKNSIPHILNDFGYSRLERAGLEMDVLPANLYLWFQQSLPQCSWKDISSIIRRLRMVKSDYEIEQIKKSAAVLHTGLTEITNIICEGITGLEIDEYPIISPHFEDQLENGMVLALEPKFVFPQTGVVGLEDDYVMTAEGLKRLTLTDQPLIQI